MRKFAVIGLGRFGKKLAIALAMSGAEVIAADKNRDEIEMIRDQVMLGNIFHRSGHPRRKARQYRRRSSKGTGNR